MLIPLEEAAGFIHSHHPVFDELWRRKDDVLTDADLLTAAGASNNATRAYVAAQLKRMRFVVEADAQAGTWPREISARLKRRSSSWSSTKDASPTSSESWKNKRGIDSTTRCRGCATGCVRFPMRTW